MTKRGRGVAPRQAHNLEQAGSIPAPATIESTRGEKEREDLQAVLDTYHALLDAGTNPTPERS